MSVEDLDEFLENGDDWERKKTSVDGVFVLRLPEYKGSPPRLAVEVNPTDSSGNPTKKRGLLLKSIRELDDFRKLLSEDGLHDLMGTIVETNPEETREERPEDES